MQGVCYNNPNWINVFWVKAVTTIYVKYLFFVMAMDGKTPKKVRIGNKPSLFHLWIFGGDACIHIPKEKQKKIDFKSMKCTLLGYNTKTKWYTLYNPITNKIILCRNIICDEGKWLLDIVGDGNNMNNDEYQKQFMIELEVRQQLIHQQVQQQNVIQPTTPQQITLEHTTSNEQNFDMWDFDGLELGSEEIVDTKKNN